MSRQDGFLIFLAEKSPNLFSFVFQKLHVGLKLGRITLVSRSGANAGSNFGGSFKAKQGGVWHRSHSCMLRGSKNFFGRADLSTVMISCPKYVATTQAQPKVAISASSHPDKTIIHG